MGCLCDIKNVYIHTSLAVCERRQETRRTHLFIVTADHLAKGDLVAEAVGGLIRVQGLGGEVWHRDLAGRREENRGVLGHRRCGGPGGRGSTFLGLGQSLCLSKIQLQK